MKWKSHLHTESEHNSTDLTARGKTVIVSRLLRPPPEAFLSPFFGLYSLYFNGKECSVFWAKQFFLSSFFPVDFSLPSSPSETVFSTDFLIIPLLQQHIQTEKNSNSLAEQCNRRKEKGSQIIRGIKKYLSTVSQQYKQYKPCSFSHTILRNLSFDKS